MWAENWEIKGSKNFNITFWQVKEKSKIKGEGGSIQKKNTKTST